MDHGEESELSSETSEDHYAQCVSQQRGLQGSHGVPQDQQTLSIVAPAVSGAGRTRVDVPLHILQAPEEWGTAMQTLGITFAEMRMALGQHYLDPVRARHAVLLRHQTAYFNALL